MIVVTVSKDLSLISKGGYDEVGKRDFFVFVGFIPFNPDDIPIGDELSNLQEAERTGTVYGAICFLYGDG